MAGILKRKRKINDMKSKMEADMEKEKTQSEKRQKIIADRLAKVEREEKSYKKKERSRLLLSKGIRLDCPMKQVSHRYFGLLNTILHEHIGKDVGITYSKPRMTRPLVEWGLYLCGFTDLPNVDMVNLNNAVNQLCRIRASEIKDKFTQEQIEEFDLLGDCTYSCMKDQTHSPSVGSPSWNETKVWKGYIRAKGQSAGDIDLGEDYIKKLEEMRNVRSKPDRAMDA